MAKKKHILHREVNNDFLIGIVLGIIVSVLFMGIFMATFKKKMNNNGQQWYVVETVEDSSMTDDVGGY